MARRRPHKVVSVLAVLGDTEAAAVLAELLASHPELRPEAEESARRLLGSDTVDGIADDVRAALEDLPVEALATRAGRVRGRGYVHETDAAYELVDEAFAPFLADLRHRAHAGLVDEATLVATGIVAGLSWHAIRTTVPSSPTRDLTPSKNSPPPCSPKQPNWA